jgi:hypothetical protein
MRGNKSPAPPGLTAPRGGELTPQRIKSIKKHLTAFFKAFLMKDYQEPAEKQKIITFFLDLLPGLIYCLTG